MALAAGRFEENNEWIILEILEILEMLEILFNEKNTKIKTY